MVAAQTALPGASATAQGLLAGASVQVHVSPDGVPNDQATAVSIDATDTEGRLGQLDASARFAAANAALLAVAGYYPNAAVTLRVVDGSGATLVSGTKAPGALPSIQ